MNKVINNCLLSMLVLILSGCMVGPNYKKPAFETAAKYKEAPPGWKMAEPKDSFDKGEWWKIFKDPDLDTLMAKVNVNNQNIAVAVAQFKEAVATLAESRANLWPTINFDVSAERQLQPANTLNSNSKPTLYNTYILEPTLSWSPDIFGAIRRAIEASEAGAEATAAQLAGTKLSMQSTLAQTYFQLRANDLSQKYLDDTVIANKENLQIIKNQYNAGTVSQLNIVQAESQLLTAQTAALDNKITRAQYEHAIAVLIGELPEKFSIPVSNVLAQSIPEIPLVVPSVLLERRQDIASAERLMQQANANIGVAIAAYFPTLTLTGDLGTQSNLWRRLFTMPTHLWSLGAAATEILFNGGLREAQLNAARFTYEQNLASYRQTVLAAFQNVEDNLVSVRILNAEVIKQDAAVAAAVLNVKLTTNQMRSGIVAYSSVLAALISEYSAKTTAITVYSRRLVSAVGLVQALGGGWDSSGLSSAVYTEYDAELPSKNCNTILNSELFG